MPIQAKRLNVLIPIELHRAARVYGLSNGLNNAQLVARALWSLIDPSSPAAAENVAEESTGHVATAERITTVLTDEKEAAHG